MNERRSKMIIAVVIGWVVILAILAGAYRLLLKPASEKELASVTGSESRYENRITVAADSFSGYAVLRSNELAEELGKSRIKLSVEDDGADYHARIQALRDGDVQLAVFTVDSFIAAGADIGEYPATIIMVIDETVGADAIVTYESGVKQISDLNHANASIVLTPDSPSEFLARTVIAHFNLPNLPDNWLTEATGPDDVYRQFKSADKRARKAYVLWEPFVTRALKEPQAMVLLDSSNLSGYVVDVLVAEREFLRDHKDQVTAFVKAYQRANYARCANEQGMIDLVIDDARKTGGESLGISQAKKLVSGIRWKNTLENYAHFGLLDENAAGGLQHIEDIILNITQVLLQTGAVDKDPVGENAATLFYSAILKEMQSSDFHPARKLDVITGVGSGSDTLQEVRGAVVLPALSDSQWNSLVEVGEMRVRPISFGRGTARINIQSRRELTELAKRLKAWPRYYLKVIGHARSVGDTEANRILAQERSAAAIALLHEFGVEANRMRSLAGTLSGAGGQAQSVSFVVGQLPY